jgi:hypothetical protein
MLRKALRHAYWARTEGFGRLVEEDRLDPRERARTAVRKAAWRARHGVAAGTAVPVYVVGLQRSGTNMIMRGLDEAPEVEVRNENDRTVFDRYRLRSDQVLAATVAASRHRVVLVKPLCDSHRVAELLALPGLAPGRALWVYRDVEARARSEVSKFGAANLRALRDIAAGRGESIWQGQSLGPEAVALVRSFDVDAMSTHTAAALFWVVRNSLFFDLGLDRRDDVRLVSYDAFVADPTEEMRAVCDAIGFPFRPELCAHVVRRETHGERSLGLDARVLELAGDLANRLEQARAGQGRP